MPIEYIDEQGNPVREEDLHLYEEIPEGIPEENSDSIADTISGARGVVDGIGDWFTDQTDAIGRGADRVGDWIGNMYEAEPGEKPWLAEDVYPYRRTQEDIGRGMANIGMDLGSGGLGLLETGADAIGWESAEDLFKSGRQGIREFRDENSDQIRSKLAQNVGEGIGQGAKFLAAGPVPAIMATGATIFGEEASNARDAGSGSWAAALEGVIDAGTETVLDILIFGRFGKLPPEAMGAIKKLVATSLKEGASEGLEEAVNMVAERLLRPEESLEPMSNAQFLGNMGQSAISGMIQAPFAGGGASMSNSRVSPNQSVDPSAPGQFSESDIEAELANYGEQFFNQDNQADLEHFMDAQAQYGAPEGPSPIPQPPLGLPAPPPQMGQFNQGPSNVPVPQQVQPDFIVGQEVAPAGVMPVGQIPMTPEMAAQGPLPQQQPDFIAGEQVVDPNVMMGQEQGPPMMPEQAAQNVQPPAPPQQPFYQPAPVTPSSVMAGQPYYQEGDFAISTPLYESGVTSLNEITSTLQGEASNEIDLDKHNSQRTMPESFSELLGQPVKPKQQDSQKKKTSKLPFSETLLNEQGMVNIPGIIEGIMGPDRTQDPGYVERTKIERILDPKTRMGKVMSPLRNNLMMWTTKAHLDQHLGKGWNSYKDFEGNSAEEFKKAIEKLKPLFDLTDPEAEELGRVSTSINVANERRARTPGGPAPVDPTPAMFRAKGLNDAQINAYFSGVRPVLDTFLGQFEQKSMNEVQQKYSEDPQLEHYLSEVGKRFGNLKGKGFVPLTHFSGDHMVILKNTKGETEHLNFFSTQEEAFNFKEELKQKYTLNPDPEVEISDQNPIFKETSEGYDGEQDFLDSDILKQLKILPGQASGWAKHMMTRQLSKGMDTDLRKTLPAYLMGASKYLHSFDFRSEMGDIIGNLPANKKNTKIQRELEDLFTRGSQGKKGSPIGSAISTLGALHFLGGLKSPVMNTIGGQILLLGSIYKRTGNLKETGKIWASAGKQAQEFMWNHSKFSQANPALAKELDDKLMSNLLTPQMYRTYLQDVHNPNNIGKVIQGIATLPIKPFDMMEKFNRISSYISGAKIYEAHDPDSKDRRHLIRGLVNESQFDYSHMNMPPIFDKAGAAGPVLALFRRYGGNHLRYFRDAVGDKHYKQALLAGGLGVAFGGLPALPFVGDMGEFFEWLMDQAGVDPKLEMTKLTSQNGVADFLYRTATNGIPDSMFGIGMSGSLAGQQFSPEGDSFAEMAGKLVLGASGQLVENVEKAHELSTVLKRNDLARQELYPIFIKRLMQAYQMGKNRMEGRPEIQNKRGETIVDYGDTPGESFSFVKDLLALAVGFHPTRIKEAQELKYRMETKPRGDGIQSTTSAILSNMRAGRKSEARDLIIGGMQETLNNLPALYASARISNPNVTPQEVFMQSLPYTLTSVVKNLDPDQYRLIEKGIPIEKRGEFLQNIIVMAQSGHPRYKKFLEQYLVDIQKKMK